MTDLYLPRGSSLPSVEGAAADLERRVQQGDPTLGWEGDPSMRVVIVEGVISGRKAVRWEVWAPDPQTREPFCVASSMTLGPELIRKIVAADTRRRDVVGEFIAKERKRVLDERKAMSERHEEVADKMHHALRKDLGDGPRIHPIPGGPT